MNLGPIKIIRKNLPLVISILFLSGLWFVVTDVVAIINPLFLPSPADVAVALAVLFADGFGKDILFTVLRVMTAFLFSIIVALPVAFLISESKFIKHLVTPYVDFIRYIPVPVLIPLAILFLGVGEAAKISLLFVGTFFQVALQFESDLNNVPTEYFDLAHSLHFSRFEKLKMSLLSAAPEMYGNMRISLGLSWSYVVIVELIAAQTGIGHMIKEAQRFSLTANVYVGILSMGMIGFLSDYILRKSYVKLFPYK